MVTPRGHDRRMLNPAPQTYRLTEVCLVCGSEDAYPALLARGTSMRARVGMRLRDAVTWRVEPVMTREMLDVLVSGIGAATGSGRSGSGTARPSSATATPATRAALAAAGRARPLRGRCLRVGRRATTGPGPRSRRPGRVAT